MKRGGGGKEGRERLHPTIVNLKYAPKVLHASVTLTKMITVKNTQSKFGGRNTGGSKQTIRSM